MKRVLTGAFTVLLALTCIGSSAQNQFPTLLADPDWFSEGEWNTLQRDADLAQRSGVPIMFAVIRGDGTSAGSAQNIANQYRAEYAVESSPGAADGIVFLIHQVPADSTKSVVVYSAGSNAFATTGLSDTTIQAYLGEFVSPLLHEGELFRASAFLMRFTRYTSLYMPPPVSEPQGFALVMNRSLWVLAPAIAAAGIAAAWRNRQRTERQRWWVVGTTIAVSFALVGVSVWAQSKIGILSAIALITSLIAWGMWVSRDSSNSRGKWRHLLPDAAITFVLILSSLVMNLNQVEITPIDRDETRWLNRAHYASDLGEPFGPTWQDYAITVGQPPLGSVAIGIGLALQQQDLRATGVWDYQYDENWYRATGGYPTEDALQAGRRTNSFIGAFATGAAYVLGRLLTNRAGGIAAGVYLAWHPLHIVLSTQALSDETFALLLLLAMIAAWQFASKPTWPRALALGILLGLGGATKLTPLLLALPLAVMGLLRIWLDTGKDAKRAGWMLLAQPLIAFAAFVGIYPWLWPNPIERTWRLFAFRASEMDAQTTAWPSANTENPFDALARFGEKLTYTHSTSQKALQHFYDWIGIDRVAVGFDLVVAAIGAVILIWIVARNGLWTPHALVSCLLTAEFAMLAIGMKADFYRYHLPVVMIVSACMSVAVGTGWSTLASLVTKRTIESTDSLAAEVATQ